MFVRVKNYKYNNFKNWYFKKKNDIGTKLNWNSDLLPLLAVQRDKSLFYLNSYEILILIIFILFMHFLLVQVKYIVMTNKYISV